MSSSPSSPPLSPFVHLHVHSDYSLLDGACDIGKLAKRAAALRMPALALTDHGNLFGALAFQQAAKAAGVKPILGCELYICKKDDHRAPAEGDSYNHLIALCENDAGYRNLVKIVSEASLHGMYYKPRISKRFLAAHSEGLIGLSACLKGEVQESLAAGRTADAERAAADFAAIFGRDSFFIEIQDQGLEAEKRLNPALVQLAGRVGLPLVATNDCHYLEHEDHRMHDVLLCIQTGKRVHDEQRMRFGSDQFYLKSGDEMLQVFSGLEPAVRRTVEIAARCQAKIEGLSSPFPHFDVPQGETLDSYFAAMARAGLERRASRIAERRRLGRTRYSPADYRERLEREIAVIQAMKYSGYFLIVWDFIRFARERGIPVGPGRGSATGSLVSYALGITDLDPLEHELLFERFLNPERVSMPDIDVDFCMLRRGEVIEYVTQKYGRENVSQIITFGTLGAKAAIKDVGRAMDLPYAEVDRVAKLIPFQVNITLEQALAASPDFQKLYEGDGRMRELVDTARRVEGLCRNAGMHAAGVVIAPRPLTELVPLFKTNRDEIVTQFDMSGLEKIGLLKMDFLGLTTLTSLQDAVAMARAGGAADLDLDNLPEDDPATYALFSSGNTGGIFQFESPGMRDILRRYRPERLNDLTALNALYRPGPIQGGQIDDFIARKHGRRPITYELPELEPILSESFGVFVYQEQVMQAANRLAGYSLAQADLLRRAMGKKNAEEMARQRENFIRGAVGRGLPAAKVERVFDLMEQFAGYGFNKSHAAAYALIAYQSAYLKAHFPVAFLAAQLNCQVGSMDGIVKHIHECRIMDVGVAGPDVNASSAAFTPDGERRIRFGLSAVKNVGEPAVRAILEARAGGGPFRSLADFCDRVPGKLLNKRVLESLIKAGALDGLLALPGAPEHAGRATLLGAAEKAMEAAQKRAREREVGQHGLFVSFDAASPAPPAALPPVAPWEEDVRLGYEKEVLGFFLTGHPLDRHADLLEDLGVVNLADLGSIEDAGERGRGGWGQRADRPEVSVAGVIVGLQSKRNKKGETWAAATFEDRSGRAELLCFAEAFRRHDALLRSPLPLLLRVRLASEDEGETKLHLVEATALAEARPVLPKALRIRLRLDALPDSAARQLADLVASRPGSAKIHLHARSGREGFEQILELEPTVTADARFRREVEALCGAGAVKIVD